MSIILYGLHGCPMCKFLEQSMKKKRMTYTKIDDIDQIKALNLHSVPILEVDGERMIYPDAIKYVRGYTENADACAACAMGG